MRITARAIVLKDDHLLVMDRNNSGHKYLALPGGAVEAGETNELAAIREIREECSIVIGNLRLVVIEDAGQTFGLQYIFLADYLSGEIKLDPDSIEAKRAVLDANLYIPKWLAVEQLRQVNFLPVELKDMLLKFIENGFPKKAVKLKIAKDSKV